MTIYTPGFSPGGSFFEVIMQNSFKKRCNVKNIVLPIVVLGFTLLDIFSDKFFGKFQDIPRKAKVAVIFFAFFAFFSLVRVLWQCLKGNKQ